MLVAEAADAIRQAARAAGYADRQVFFSERGFDWNHLRAESASLSLFAERRVLEVRLPTGKPGDGAQVLQQLIEDPAPDTILLVISAQLERATLNSAWVKAMERKGAWVTVWPIDIARLPRGLRRGCSGTAWCRPPVPPKRWRSVSRATCWRLNRK
ncbi:MAG: hypothetical protein HC872_05000 [Gammaproteobacteria bacterium]|nr:hypothetical protein [Gammaproteobacteria bacterium]